MDFKKNHLKAEAEADAAATSARRRRRRFHEGPRVYTSRSIKKGREYKKVFGGLSNDLGRKKNLFCPQEF